MDELADSRLAPPGRESGIELADMVLGPAQLDAGENVDDRAAGLLVEYTDMRAGSPSTCTPCRWAGDVPLGRALADVPVRN
ncbi:hypothetical protein OG927_31120 [Streptomyces clavifer]|uniref:hypothetical protein n=1 Tax=Streptomyces clavifer TaxID=68188 RepID=UPI002E8090EF|nr:hypothetical protein [Streptomyces clavifer]WUC31526.1 hypothetical protein OG927_31120 [Streptomyces clavifer]